MAGGSDLHSPDLAVLKVDECQLELGRSLGKTKGTPPIFGARQTEATETGHWQSTCSKTAGKQDWRADFFRNEKGRDHSRPTLQAAHQLVITPLRATGRVPARAGMIALNFDQQPKADHQRATKAGPFALRIACG